MEFDERYTFCFAGVVDVGETFNAAIAFPEAFFMLAPEVRQIQIAAWIDLLKGCQHEEFLLEVSYAIEEEEHMAVLVSDVVVETREIPDNVVEFPGVENE